MQALWTACQGRMCTRPPSLSLRLSLGRSTQCARDDVRRRCLSTGSALDALKERDLVNDCTSGDLDAVFATRPPVYCGFDPTADTLHVGNLVAIMALIHFRRKGHPVIALVGGATGQIGDPSGRHSERSQLGRLTLETNVAGIDATLRRIFTNATTLFPPDANSDNDKGESIAAAESKRQFVEAVRAARGIGSTGGSHGDILGAEGTGGSGIGNGTPQNDPMVAVVNNLDWFANMSVLDFVGGVGRLFRMTSMLAKESVKARLDSPDGMSYTEFSYQMFQAYDFYYLHRHYGCRVQIGGSDQWGNITAGCELIRRIMAERYADAATPAHSPSTIEVSRQSTLDTQSTATSLSSPSTALLAGAYGVTLPLVTTSTGEKFGKSAGNAVWLHEARTSPYELFQFFMKAEDADVEKYLKMFTFLSVEEIRAIVERHVHSPHLRTAQRTLASHVTRLIHGDGGLHRAERVTAVLFGDASIDGRIDLSPSDVEGLLRNAHVTKVDRRRLPPTDATERTAGAQAVAVTTGTTRTNDAAVASALGDSKVVSLAVDSGLCASRGAARRAVEAGGVYVNNVRVQSATAIVSKGDLFAGGIVVLRMGKANYRVLQFV
eukprot:Opistho-2@13303